MKADIVCATHFPTTRFRNDRGKRWALAAPDVAVVIMDAAAKAPLSGVPRMASDLGIDRLLQAFEPKRHVAQNSVDKERRSRSHAAAGPTLDMLLYTLQVHVIIYLEVVALEIELSLVRKLSKPFRLEV